MTFIQTYQEFAQLQIAEKFSIIDSFPEGINLVKADGVKLRKLFSGIFEEDDNNYLRAKSLDILSFLIQQKKIKYQSLINILFEIESDDDVFILIKQVKYLFLLYPDDQEGQTIMQKLTTHSHGEVSSEAYYRLGLINLFRFFEITTPEDFALHLKKTQKYFIQSFRSIENRVDAQYFNSICEYLIFLLSKDLNSASETFRKISTLLKNRNFLSMSNSLPTLDLKIYTLLFSLYELCKHLDNEWINISNEIKLLFLYQERFTHLELTNQNLLEFKEHLNEKILNSYYSNNKDIRAEKIEVLISQPDIDDDLKEFLTELKQSILSKSVKKKEYQTSLLIKLIRQFPHISEEQLKVDTSQIDLNNSSEMADLIFRYSNQDTRKKILFMYPSLPTLETLDFGQEIKGIKRSLEAYNSALIFITEESVLIEEVVCKLTKHQPFILHLSTHGSQNEGLLFKDQYEQEVGLQVEHFIKYIQILNKEKKVLEGIILNACHSSEFAKEISRFVNFSIGMLGEIPDEVSIPFTDIFYRHLSNGLEARKCFELAKIHLDTLDIEWQSEEEGIEKLSDIPKFYSQI